MKKVVLFYKRLLEVGGAERLLVNSYITFKNLGYAVDIVSYEINKKALFDCEVDEIDLIELKSRSWVGNILKFISYLKNNRNALILCDSGHIDMFIASKFSSTSYSLHLHHPLFMSFNDFDKYSIQLSKYFNKRTKSNYGAQRFIAIRKDINLLRQFLIDIRAYFSIKSIQSAKNTFVLSKYAQEEKRELFGIDSKVLCGALDENIFKYMPTNLFKKYDQYDQVILTIGRLDINKRIDVLLDAFKILINKGLNGILLIGGNGPEIENLKNQSIRLGIDNRVEFLHFIPDNLLFDYYSRADLFVSIDWADYRITSYEAWAMGTKVLLSNEVKYDQYFQENNYLFLTHPTSERTAQSIENTLFKEPRISRKQLNRYLSAFTWNNYNKAILKVLENED